MGVQWTRGARMSITGRAFTLSVFLSFPARGNWCTLQNEYITCLCRLQSCALRVKFALKPQGNFWICMDLSCNFAFEHILVTNKSNQPCFFCPNVHYVYTFNSPFSQNELEVREYRTLSWKFSGLFDERPGIWSNFYCHNVWMWNLVIEEGTLAEVYQNRVLRKYLGLRGMIYRGTEKTT